MPVDCELSTVDSPRTPRRSRCPGGARTAEPGLRPSSDRCEAVGLDLSPVHVARRRSVQGRHARCPDRRTRVGRTPADGVTRGRRRPRHPLSGADFSPRHSAGILDRPPVVCRTRSGATGELPKRPKGSDCKSAVYDFGGSNPSLATLKAPVIRGFRRFRRVSRASRTSCLSPMTRMSRASRTSCGVTSTTCDRHGA